MNDNKFKDTLQACFYGDKGAYNQCMYEFQHRGLINNQLQSNWNSLREWLEVNDRYSQGYFKQVLEYMNKLERKDKE